MPPSDSDFKSVATYLTSLHLHFSEGWLIECINNLKSSNTGMSPVDLNKAVYQRWLFVNLRDMKVASLPPNISAHEKLNLSGFYAVQVESMVDSSRSSYSELRRIRNVRSKNLEITEKSNEEEIRAKRCLTFVVSDGVQEVEAMEYQLIPSICLDNVNFLPGFKILIRGPVMCRKGMLLLSEQNVKIYGGRVDALCTANNLESLLCRSLGLSDTVMEKKCFGGKENMENNNSDVTHTPSVEDHGRNSSVHIHPSNDSSSSINSIEIPEFSEVSDIFDDFSCGVDTFHLKGNLSNNVLSTDEPCIRRTKKAKLSVSNQDINVCISKDANQFSTQRGFPTATCYEEQIPDDVLLDLDPSAFSPSGENDEPTLTDQLNSDMHLEELDLEQIVSESADRNYDPSSSSETIEKERPSFINENMMETNEFEISGHFSKTSPQNLKRINPYPFIYLQQIKDVILKRPTNFTVKAIILTLKSKINIKNDEFSLKANITDGSLTIEVKFSSNVLEDILEFSPCEITAMMNEKARNSAICDRLKTIFFTAQQKLLSMNCLMDVQFFSNGSLPCVLALQEIQLKHLHALKGRL